MEGDSKRGRGTRPGGTGFQRAGVVPNALSIAIELRVGRKICGGKRLLAGKQRVAWCK